MRSAQVMSLLVMLGMPTVTAADFDHRAWDQLLDEYVQEFDGGQVTAVDYAGITGARSRLTSYLDSLAAVSRPEFDSWAEAEQLAFLINGYNAWTVDLIVSEYSQIDSIRDIGFLPGAAWRRNIVSLFGEQVSLDDVEHGMIRGWDRYQEPRIHFAVNCAAIGCPALRAEAYTGPELESQLEDSTRLFLSDRSRNYIEGDAVYISRIFDWYEEDFEQGWLGVNSVHEFLVRYAEVLGASPEQSAGLRQESLRIRYLDYDWGLNELPRQRASD